MKTIFKPKLCYIDEEIKDGIFTHHFIINVFKDNIICYECITYDESYNVQSRIIINNKLLKEFFYKD